MYLVAICPTTTATRLIITHAPTNGVYTFPMGYRNICAKKCNLWNTFITISLFLRYLFKLTDKFHFSPFCLVIDPEDLIYPKQVIISAATNRFHSHKSYFPHQTTIHIDFQNKGMSHFLISNDFNLSRGFCFMSLHYCNLAGTLNITLNSL